VTSNQKLQNILGVDIGILATQVLRARKTRKLITILQLSCAIPPSALCRSFTMDRLGIVAIPLQLVTHRFEIGLILLHAYQEFLKWLHILGQFNST
jgi:hypothetical protein